MAGALSQKFQIKSGKLIVLNAPKGYADHLADELPDLTVSTRAAGHQGGAARRDAVDGLRERIIESEDRC